MVHANRSLPTASLCRLVAFGVVLLPLPLPLFAETYSEHFHGPNPSWKVRATEHVKVLTHRRSPQHGTDGTGEFLSVETNRAEQSIHIEHVLPKARVLNELEVGLWVRSETPGVRIKLRVVLPEYKDPNGKMIALLIPGDVVEQTGDWQRLTCRTDDKLVQERLASLRARLKQTVTPKRMVVDRVVLTWPLSPGVNELALDELTFGPLVEVEEFGVTRTGHEAEPAEESPVVFRLGRLEIEGNPFFPVIAPYHGEPLKQLAADGFNIVWLPDYTDQALLRSAREAGLWVTATPPAAVSGDDEVRDAGLLPFTAKTRPIAFWMLGTRVSPQAQTRLANWVDQIQEADQGLRRPIAADVSGDETFFSRELDLLGISRHTMGGTLSLREYRNWLQQRRAQAVPGSWCFTWIQAAPSPAIAEVWDQHQIPLQLEPEQIRLQAYAALAAGMRGIGFWTPRALSEESPADRETLLALRQINWELRLMEPWLATANAVSKIPVSIETDARQKGPYRFQLRDYGFQGWKRRLGQPGQGTDNSVDPELSAAVLRTEYGTMLLPMWLDDYAQFVPGQLAANKLSLVVPGIDETASAWEITTTGIHNLPRERVSGGVKVTLKNFDQTACILLTSRQDLIEQVKQRVAAIEERSARTSLTLAELKLERVRAIDQQLGEFGLRQPEGPRYLGLAWQMYQQARAALSQQDWQSVRVNSEQAMQMARVLQREHWESAVEHLSSPVASPYSISYSSLPAQARLALQLTNDAQSSRNLVPSGNFDDETVPLPAVGWKHEQQAPATVRAQADLHPDPHRGKFCLRLLARTIAPEQPVPTGKEFVSITTPPVTVYAGNAARISGWIKIPADLAAESDGVMIYDGLQGRSLALRFHQACDWQRFEFVREAVESQEMTVTFALTGLGEVDVDDIEVTVHPLANIEQTAGQEVPAKPRPAAAPTRWTDLGRLNPRPARRPKAMTP
jgi:hypothetical protein